MARNIEIKARVADREALEAAVAAIATAGPTRILQDDTFFACPNGRMKLRDFATGEGELIFYRRSDIAGPKPSEYFRSPTTAVASLREALALGYGEIGRVRKRRTLYLVGRTRVHLDRVEGLGEFLELEVVLAEGEPAQAGVDEARDLMARLGIAPSQLVQGAYVDLSGGPEIGDR